MLSGARIEKIQEPAQGLLTITFFNANGKKQFYAHFGKQQPFFFISDGRLAANTTPSSQIMRVRRYFNGKRLAAVVCQFLQRKIWLLTSGAPTNEKKAVWLCLDIVKGPQLYFLDESEYPKPDVLPWPQRDELKTALTDWRSWPVLTPPLRKTLALLDELDQLALLEDLRAGGGNVFLYGKQNKIDKISAWPLPAPLRDDLQETECDNVLSALEKAGQDIILSKIYDQQNDRLLAPVAKRLKKLRKLLPKLDADEQRLLAMRKCGDYAIALRDNLWHLSGDSHASSITVPAKDGNMQIPLQERFTIKENMERYFHNGQKAKRGLRMLEERKQGILEEIKSLEQTGLTAVDGQPNVGHEPSQDEKLPMLNALRNTLPKQIQVLISSDGYIMLRGKDAKGNHILRRFASPHDLWAHVETGAGAHVIIRRRHPNETVPDTTLDEAGSLAALKSWLRNSQTASIMYAEVRHVKPARNGPLGKMIIDKIAMTRLVTVDPEVENKLLASSKKQE